MRTFLTNDESNEVEIIIYLINKCISISKKKKYLGGFHIFLENNLLSRSCYVVNVNNVPLNHRHNKGSNHGYKTLTVDSGHNGL